MIDLIARLQKATTSDRELDAAIYCEKYEYGFLRFERWNQFAGRLFYSIVGMELHCESDGFPLYTSSVDAALTLMPDGVEVIDFKLSWDTATQRGHPACSIRWYEPGGKGNDWKACSVSAKTIPITVCLAAMTLRSRNEFTIDNSDSGPAKQYRVSGFVADLKDPGVDVGGVSAAAPGSPLV